MKLDKKEMKEFKKAKNMMSQKVLLEAYQLGKIYTA
jgi:hypothetical protein